MVSKYVRVVDSSGAVGGPVMRIQNTGALRWILFGIRALAVRINTSNT